MLHLVNKLEFEAVCATESQAFDVRHYFSRICQHQVSVIIEDICSRYTAEDEWIQIERLEIDLGRIGTTAFETEFRSALYSNFETELYNKIQSLSGGTRKFSKKVSNLELLMHFLQHGV